MFPDGKAQFARGNDLAWRGCAEYADARLAEGGCEMQRPGIVADKKGRAGDQRRGLRNGGLAPEVQNAAWNSLQQPRRDEILPVFDRVPQQEDFGAARLDDSLDKREVSRDGPGAIFREGFEPGVALDLRGHRDKGVAAGNPLLREPLARPGKLLLGDAKIG